MELFLGPNRGPAVGCACSIRSPQSVAGLWAALTRDGRNYVSQLARELGISRPLLHLHLQKLEEAGLVTSRLELSSDGKALNYFEVAKFDFELTPAVIATAAKSLTDSK